MADVDPAAARRAVVELEGALRMDEWPQTEHTWFRPTSPRGAWHLDRFCPRLRVSDTRQDRAPLSVVGDKRCSWCAPPGEERLSDDSDRLAFVEAHRLLSSVVDQLEAGGVVDTDALALCLGALPRNGPGRPERAALVCDTASVVLAAVGATGDHRAKAAVYTAACAAKALSTEGRYNLRLKKHNDGPPKPRKELRVRHWLTDFVYEDWWHTFVCLVSAEGLGFEAAAARTIAGATMPQPDLRDLDGITVRADRPVGVDDLVQAWQDRYRQEAQEIITDWAAQAQENLTLSEQAGLVTVASPHCGGFDVRDRLGMFPIRWEPDGVAVLTVPAAVAVEWMRTRVARLCESDLCPPEYLAAMNALRREGMSTLVAMAVAREVCQPDA